MDIATLNLGYNAKTTEQQQLRSISTNVHVTTGEWKPLDLLADGSMEASRQFIATMIWTEELHNSQVDTSRKVHWAPQEQDGTEDNPTSAPEPENQGSVPRTDETRQVSTNSAAELKDGHIALDSLQQGHWLTYTVIDRHMMSLEEVNPKTAYLSTSFFTRFYDMENKTYTIHPILHEVHGPDLLNNENVVVSVARPEQWAWIDPTKRTIK